MEQQAREFVRDHGGVASVSELARFLEVDEGAVRAYARERGLRRIGSTFVFSEDSAAEMARQLEEETDEEEDEEDGDEEEEDEEDADDDDAEDEEDEANEANEDDGNEADEDDADEDSDGDVKQDDDVRRK